MRRGRERKPINMNNLEGGGGRGAKKELNNYSLEC